MAFSSIPAYLDTSNWQQQQNHQIIIGSSSAPPQPHGGAGVGSIRPGSMAERARIANIALPEAALKCPRCDSTNTKFCYFNNYSLSQPRHFCKTCRRYWTRGGALRNVPVGGGCRRNNKRTKSKSPAATTDDDRARPQPPNNNPSSTTSADPTAGGSPANMLGLPPLRFMSQHHQLNESFAAAGDHMGMGGYGGMMTAAPPLEEMSFHGGVEPWRMQQFPFQDQSAAAGDINYQFGGGVRPKLSSSMLSQLAAIKMEERTALNLSRQFSGNINIMPQQWNNNDNNDNPNTVNWTDLSNFSPSSTGNQL